MFPTFPKRAPENILSDAPDSVRAWFWDLFGTEERKRFLLKQQHLIKNGTKIDLDDAYLQMHGIFWHRVRVACTVFLLSTLLFLARFPAFGLPFSSRAFLALAMLIEMFGVLLFIKAWFLPFRRSIFIKAPIKSEDYAFLIMIGGERILRKWIDDFPEIRRFVFANKMLESISLFEYEIVEAYVHNQRRVDKGQ